MAVKLMAAESEVFGNWKRRTMGSYGMTGVESLLGKNNSSGDRCMLYLLCHSKNQMDTGRTKGQAGITLLITSTLLPKP